MDERKYRILQAIIDDYIMTAMPVGSRTISRKEGIELSSATIRNEMSDLEELGYLDQPHSSAGRVPSWKAYRWYVDQMMRVSSLPPEDFNRIRSMFGNRMRQMEEIIGAAARTISELTNYTSVVLKPQEKEQKLRRAQLVRVTDERALLVLVTEGGMTSESIVPVPKDCPDEHLYAISTMLTRHIMGRNAQQLGDAMREISRDMADQASLFDAIASTIEADGGKRTPYIVLGGTSQLLKYPEYADVEKARAMLDMLEGHGKLAQILASRAGMELSISIGPEIDVDGMNDCSLVTVAYSIGEDLNGTMGVIGPTRMHYGRVLSVLDAMKQALNHILYSEEDGN